MAIWCVCFDLLPEPMPDVAQGIRGLMRGAFPDIPDALAALGPTVRVSPSSCLLASDLSPDQIMDRLHPHVLNPSERIIVLPVAAGVPWRTHSGAADDPVAGWVAEHLGDCPAEPGAGAGERV
ncbi:MAG TPA: hypothetical protein VD866_11390 [Urbifossiella sp.]|nr:hypothetical protein [Urbifossiella sp.]